MTSRKDYNKPNRCPGWSGAGIGYLSYPWDRETGCPDGSSGYYADGIERGYLRASWSFHECSKCGLRTLPYALRWIDPDWLIWNLVSVRRFR